MIDPAVDRDAHADVDERGDGGVGRFAVLRVARGAGRRLGGARDVRDGGGPRLRPDVRPRPLNTTAAAAMPRWRAGNTVSRPVRAAPQQRRTSRSARSVAGDTAAAASVER